MSTQDTGSDLEHYDFQWVDVLTAGDCEPEERLDFVTRDAALLFEAPIAMINLVTSKHIITKACIGSTQGQKLEHSGLFCSRAVQQDAPMIISDTTKDAEFKNSHLVTGPLKIRSYLGKSLRAPDGTRIGTLCLLDTKTRTYSEKQLALLHDLAEQAESHLQAIINASLTPLPVFN